jgi:two-component system response regulator (stage 0 sporulation protein A)
MPQYRVLISDNCRAYADLLSNCLSANSDIAIVGIAEDGAQTFKMLQSTNPDVLLLDIIMPNVDGLEVLRRLDLNDNSPLVFVISAVGNEEIIKQALALGAKYYFVKPFDPVSIASKIKEIKLAV